MGVPVIPGFRILRALGAGGMGQVFLVEPDGMAGAVRALKVLTVASGADAAGLQRRERFVREGDLLARLHGAPGIVRVHGAGAHGDLLWLCMEHVDGRDLSLVLQERGRLPWAEATRIARGIALGLAEAHDRGVIHRDVKPANVILDRTGAAALVDFGIAQATDLERLTRTGVSVGTPVYFSPEQAAGRPLDGRSDVYSLGVVLFELLTGELPFDDDVPFPALLEAILHERPRPPGALTPGLPADVERAVLSALTKSPEQRPDARALAASLDACLDGEDGGAVPSSRGARRGAAAALVAIGLGVLAFAFVSSTGPPSAPAEPAPSLTVTVEAPATVEDAELAVSEAAAAVGPARPEARARARRAVEALPPGPDRSLQELRLAWDEHTQLGAPLTLSDVLDVLARARALSGSPVPALRTRARLLEGEVLVGLCWFDTAMPLLVGVRDALASSPDERRPTCWVRVGTATLVAPPDLAVRLLLARACGQRLDGATALAAAEDAAALARELELAEAGVAAEAMRAEALALLDRAPEARDALAAATQLLSRVAPDLRAPVQVLVDTTTARLARWGLGGELVGLRLDDQVATTYLIEAEAELHRAALLDPGVYPTLAPIDAAALARARRALRLAIASALEPELEAVAWAVMVRAHLLAGDLAAAEDALARARSASPERNFAVRHSAALVRGARGERAAVEDLRLSLRKIANSGSTRLPLRAAGVLAAGAETLWVLKEPAARLVVLEELWTAAEALRLPPPIRERIGQAALEAARAMGRQVEPVEQELARLRSEVAELVPMVRAALADSPAGVLDAAAMKPLLGVLERCPLDPGLYDALWARGAELQAWGFDSLALAFELRPSIGPDRGNLTRKRSMSSEGSRELAVELLRRHLSQDERATDLPVRRDDDLRRALAVLVAREAGLELPVDTILSGVIASARALERQPRAPAAWLTLGYARLELGDPGGALAAFDHAAALHSPFEPAHAAQAAWPRFYAALAHGALGDPAAAAARLRQAIGAGFRFHERLRDPRLAGVASLDALEVEARANGR